MRKIKMEYRIINGELYHYGVKGMKWGVRRFRGDVPKPIGKFIPTTDKTGPAEENRRRWGDFHRRPTTPSTDVSKKAAKKVAKAQKKWDENVKKNWIHAYNRAADKDNATLEDFNSKYKDIDLNDRSKSKQNRKYAEDYCKRWNDMYVKELESAFGKAPINDGRKWCERVPMFADPADIYDD